MMGNKQKAIFVKQFIWNRLVARSIYLNVVKILALMVSWYISENWLWALFHWMVAPYYLIYSLLTRVFADGGAMDIVNYYFGTL